MARVPFGGVAVGDFDRSGLQDLYCTNVGFGIATDPNVLLKNQGGMWTGEQAAARVEPIAIEWGAICFDYDNDGHLDPCVCNAFDANRPYVCGGTWPCVDIAISRGVDNTANSYAAAVADIDIDGDGDFDDVGILVAVLPETDLDPDHILLNDMNGDSVVNGADIDRFLAVYPGLPRDRVTGRAGPGRIAIYGSASLAE